MNPKQNSPSKSYEDKMDKHRLEHILFSGDNDIDQRRQVLKDKMELKRRIERLTAIKHQQENMKNVNKVHKQRNNTIQQAIQELAQIQPEKMETFQDKITKCTMKSLNKNNQKQLQSPIKKKRQRKDNNSPKKRQQKSPKKRQQKSPMKRQQNRNENMKALEKRLEKELQKNKGLMTENESLKKSSKYLNIEMSELKNMLSEQKEDDNALKNRNMELKQMNDMMMNEYKELEYRYKDLEEKYKEQKRMCNGSDIAEWIVSMDRERYGKYYDVLLKNIKMEGIDGSCLEDLDKNDLHRLGITQFKDKRDIFNAIQQMVSEDGNNEGNDENDILQQKEGVATVNYDF